MSMNQVTVKCEDCLRKVALKDTQSVFPKDTDGETIRKTVCFKCAAKYPAEPGGWPRSK